ncbi:MAG: 50S ribosomal protein L6 [Candidatus Diapherotrites archaeon]|nr:50S ribosomal protein L6 [Candidatus Diapherotrites archaeon]
MKEKNIIKITIPENISIKKENGKIIVKGRNELSRSFKENDISLTISEREIEIKPISKKKSAYAKAKTCASIIENMIMGAKGKEYVYTLEIVYSHFPISVLVKGDKIEISNLRGGKKPKIAKIIGNTKVEVKGKNVYVRSYDKYAAGQTAANIENATKISQTDRRIFQDGVYIVEKAKEEGG